MRNICSICVSDDTFPSITYDENNICSECKKFSEFEKNFPNDENGKKLINIKIDEIKKRNKSSDYDVVIGVSGGRDSTYLMYWTKKILKLRVLAVHFNDGFGNPLAGKNMRRASEILDINLITYTSDWKLSKDLKLSFLNSNVPDIETSTDVGIASALYAAAYNHRIKDIFVGQSFRTEGICPLEWNFLDGKYVESVQKKFGSEKFPAWNPGKINFNLSLLNIFYYTFVKRIKVFFPYYHLDYNRNEITSIIEKECEWQNTGAHYYDDLYQTLMSKWYLEKFNIDRRKYNYSAMIRTGSLSRSEALKKLENKYVSNQDEIVELCLKRLGINSLFLETLIKNNHKKSFRNYKTSYQTIKIFRFLIKKMSEKKIIPSSTYFKYFEN